MRHKQGIGCDVRPLNAKAQFSLFYDPLHHLADMVYIQAGTVESAVGGDSGKDFRDAAHAAFAYGIFGFDDQCGSTHTHQHAVAAAVKRPSSPPHSPDR